MEFGNAQKQLNIIGERLINNIKDAIKKSKKINTGNFYNSVTAKLIPPGGLRIKIAAEYAHYVIEGSRLSGGRKRQPPSGAIERWLLGENGSKFFSKMKKTNKKLTIQSASFIIARSIAKKGIQPMKQRAYLNMQFEFLQNTKAIHELEVAYAKDTEEELKKYFPR